MHPCVTVTIMEESPYLMQFVKCMIMLLYTYAAIF